MIKHIVSLVTNIIIRSEKVLIEISKVSKDKWGGPIDTIS